MQAACFYCLVKVKKIKVKAMRQRMTGGQSMGPRGREGRKGAERQNKKAHDAKGQRTEGHCQHMAQRSF